MREGLERLGVTSPEDKRFAVTLVYDERMIRLNYCNWAVMQFCEPGVTRYTAALAIFRDRSDVMGECQKHGTFANSVPPVCLCEVPIESICPLKGSKRALFEETFDYIKTFFQNWKASSYVQYSRKEIAEAIFDKDKRAYLYIRGLQKRGVFSHETFRVLKKLEENPTRDCYASIKEESKRYLESPFQKLFTKVTEGLPPEISEVMETEKGLFSRIPKNDYGRGGAWPHYWGAIYRKGGRRVEDAQLYVWINHKAFGYGFYIGEVGDSTQRTFLNNIRQYQGELISALEPLSDRLNTYTPGDNSERVKMLEKKIATPEFGEQDRSWVDWLADPDKYNYGLGVTLTRDQVLQISEEEMIADIRDAFITLFPLILFSISDDPLPAIYRYLPRETEVYTVLKEPEDMEVKEEYKIQPEYTLEELSEKTGFPHSLLKSWVRGLERKNQAILYGPPGTGKTFVAERLARHLIGGGDGFSDLVQFHPSYSYEDFLQGIRPQSGKDKQLEYPTVPGRFLEFCRKAKTRTGKCVLIIDEINRANLSRVFGELMYLLEYRDRRIPLSGGGYFSIPDNVRLIGTMNTADRSIALVDHALRRRFAFLALYPEFEVLKRYHETKQTGFPIDDLISKIKEINGQINNKHYTLGITFFLRKDLADQIEDIWKMEIEPYLEEYFFDQPEKVARFEWDKVKASIFR